MLAQDIAKMPLLLRETTVVNGRQRTVPALDHPIYPLLMFAPNRWQTSYQARFFQASQLLMNGNSFFQKIVDQKGDVIELIPLNAWDMSVKWDYDAPLSLPGYGKVTEIDRNTNRKVPVPVWHYYGGTGQMRKFYQPELWHVSINNFDAIGIEGASMIALGKEAISLLIAAEEAAGRQFANGMGVSGFLTFPVESEITEEQAQSVYDRLQKDFTGSHNAAKLAMIPGGAKFEKMAWNAQESQLLDSRKWNEETVARMFGGAPLVVKLGLGQQNSTYASTTAFMDEYWNTSLLPLATAIEQTITRDLLTVDERGKLYAKHNANIILRGSPKERAETNQIRLQSFQMTPNEARADEDLDAIEGGDFLTGGTGTPVIFDPEEQEFFIPGQLPPQAVMDAQAEQSKQNAQAAADKLAAAQQSQQPDDGGSDDSAGVPDEKPVPPKKKPSKTKARLEAIANSLAERVMRKTAKADLDARFVSEVLACSLNDAGEYVAKYKSMTPDEQRTALVALVEGENNEQD